MKTYYIIWTYIANHSRLTKIDANSPEDAIKRTCGFFSEDFRKKAKIFVFDKEPVFASVDGILDVH